MSPTKRQHYTAREAAELCGTSVWTIYRRIEDGRLESYRAAGGRNRLVTSASLEKFLLENGMPLPAAATDGGTQILVVDDEADICRLLEDTLGRQPEWHVDTAESGFMAGALLESKRPDLILLDIHLGDIDGRELLAHIATREELAHAKVIAISAYMREKDRNALLDQGFDAFERKPFVLEKLIETIHEILRQAAPRRATYGGGSEKSA